MAEKIALECFLCSETFRDPVTLGCHHSFCLNCLKTFWKQMENKNCPICKRRESKDIIVNFTLKELADSHQEAESSKEEVTLLCRKHPEEPKLFCEEEQRAVCLVCDFPHHQSHKLVPIEQAVKNLKDQVNGDLQSLLAKSKTYKTAEQTYIDVVQHSKKQVVDTERQIRAEFEQIHQFLREEEEASVAALTKEGEQKGKTVGKEMKIIRDKISSLSRSISALEQELQKPYESFLSSYKNTQASARIHCTLSEPQLVSGALIDVAKHQGNLNFRVCEKMKERVTFTPVILDPNTANPWLCLSKDLTSVRRADTMQQLPHNPERNAKYPCVLGSEGFSSGKHSWDVEVGDHPDWDIGFTKVTVDWKKVKSASPEYGMWNLQYNDGDYIDGYGKNILVQRNLQKMRVQLDYDGGEVSFYDPVDMTHIYTYKDTFTEKLYPWLSVGKAGDAKTTDIKVLPSRDTLSEKILSWSE